LLRAVLSVCTLYNWRTLHVRPAITAKGYRTAVQGTGVGFPDLLAIKGGTMIVAELKSDKGKVTEAQEAWLKAFEPVASLVTVWRPIDWANGSILAELSGSGASVHAVGPRTPDRSE